MKTILVEGITDFNIIQALFKDRLDGSAEIRITHGFANMIAMAKTLIDYNHQVLMIADSDSNEPNNVRASYERFQNDVSIGRTFNIVWMEPCIESVLRQVLGGHEGQKRKSHITFSRENKEKLLNRNEFKLIKDFIG